MTEITEEMVRDVCRSANSGPQPRCTEEIAQWALEVCREADPRSVAIVLAAKQGELTAARELCDRLQEANKANLERVHRAEDQLLGWKAEGQRRLVEECVRRARVEAAFTAAEQQHITDLRRAALEAEARLMERHGPLLQYIDWWTEREAARNE